MKRNLNIFLVLLLAIATGLGAAVYQICRVENNPLFFNHRGWVGTSNSPLGQNPLLTAQVTLFALFALPSKEAVYLFARKDGSGAMLHSKNNYTISGNIHQIKAKYWSITAYGSDLFLVPNTAKQYSFNNKSIQADSSGNFTITLAPQPSGNNWLPTPPNGHFNLLLRMYLTEPAFAAELATAPLPVIKKM